MAKSVVSFMNRPFVRMRIDFFTFSYVRKVLVYSLPLFLSENATALVMKYPSLHMLNTSCYDENSLYR